MSMFSPLVYVVEDDDVYQKYLSKVISDKGGEVMSFSDGESGLKAVKDKKPDLVLLDFSLKGLNGLDTLIAIKNARKNLNVFVLTGLDDPKVADECLKNGASKFLIKEEESMGQIFEQLIETKKRKSRNVYLGAAIAVLAVIVGILII